MEDKIRSISFALALVLQNKYRTRKNKRAYAESRKPLVSLERKTGFEPATPTLARSININRYP
jgi:hypothetical protein